MELLQQIATAAGVLALLGATLWWLRARGVSGFRAVARATSLRRLQALERLPLSPQHTLHLVRAGGRNLLVAAWPSGCALLESWEERGAPEVDG
jgi:flagellar biogenesis protein FliO